MYECVWNTKKEKKCEHVSCFSRSQSPHIHTTYCNCPIFFFLNIEPRWWNIAGSFPNRWYFGWAHNEWALWSIFTLSYICTYNHTHHTYYGHILVYGIFCNWAITIMIIMFKWFSIRKKKPINCLSLFSHHNNKFVELEMNSIARFLDSERKC